MAGTRGRRVAVSGAVAVLVLAAPIAPAPAEPAGPLVALVDAAARRLQAAEPVAAFKWNTGGTIEDPGRVRQELVKLGAEATAAHVDPNYVTRVFGDQINATEAIEYSRFADWKLTAADAPAGAPDLSESRSAIDGLNHTMLTQIVAGWDLLHSPGCVPELDAARSDVVRARQLDGLYQQALSLATRSYCQG